MPFRGTWELRGNHSSIIWPFCRRFSWQRMNTEGERWRKTKECESEEKVKAKTSIREIIFIIKFTDVLTDVAFFALFCFVAQADFKSVDFTRQVTETDAYIFYFWRNHPF